MTQMFDNLADSARASMEAGRRIQESWFEAIGGSAKATPSFDGMFGQAEKIATGWLPVAGKNMQAVAETMNTTFQAGMDLFKTACDATMKSGEGDMYRKGRELWDATFSAYRNGVSAWNHAGRRIMENWAAFCQTASCECGTKPATKPARNA